MKFWLGTHKTGWLGTLGVGLMVSRAQLAQRKSLPRAKAPWVLDSGAFSELAAHGGWPEYNAGQYVTDVRRFQSEIGNMEWAAIQDWMCEPSMLAKTGRDVQQHQRLTLQSYLTLRALAPEIPWLPVLQGWTESQYHAHAYLYETEGIDLASLPVVGLGSVCRRQATAEIEQIVRSLSDRGYKLHGFGMKTLGLIRCADVLASADSLAWSYDARRSAPLAGCTHRSCANCHHYAIHWRLALLAKIHAALAKPHQFPLLTVAA